MYKKDKSERVGYGDAFFAADPDTQKVYSWIYIFIMGGAPIRLEMVTKL